MFVSFGIGSFLRNITFLEIAWSLCLQNISVHKIGYLLRKMSKALGLIDFLPRKCQVNVSISDEIFLVAYLLTNIVAQLVKRSLSTQEIHGSIPVFGIYYKVEHYLPTICRLGILKRRKIRLEGSPLGGLS